MLVAIFGSFNFFMSHISCPCLSIRVTFRGLLRSPMMIHSFLWSFISLTLSTIFYWTSSASAWVGMYVPNMLSGGAGLTQLMDFSSSGTLSIPVCVFSLHNTFNGRGFSDMVQFTYNRKVLFTFLKDVFHDAFLAAKSSSIQGHVCQ